jgi:hypothetical protein
MNFSAGQSYSVKLVAFLAIQIDYKFVLALWNHMRRFMVTGHN